MINLFPLSLSPGGGAVLAQIVVFDESVDRLAPNPEHASSRSKMAKDIKRMKYWMPVTIG
jgi:hypothetical protein